MIIKAGSAKVGERYLSKQNTPVKVEGFNGDKVRVSSKAFDRVIEIDKDYPLKPFDDQQVDHETKELINFKTREEAKNTENKEEKTTKQTVEEIPETEQGEQTMTETNDVETRKRGGIAAVIDPLLFEGGRTVAEIAELVKGQVGELFRGKNLTTNVRARITTHQKKGFRLEKGDKGQVKLVK